MYLSHSAERRHMHQNVEQDLEKWEMAMHVRIQIFIYFMYIFYVHLTE